MRARVNEGKYTFVVNWSTVQGFCVQGCGPTLVLDDLGRIICVHEQCPQPESVHSILADPQQHEHPVVLGEQSPLGFRTVGMVHPLKERLGEGILKGCPLEQWMKGSNWWLDNLPVGEYSVVAVRLEYQEEGRTLRGHGWRWVLPRDENDCEPAVWTFGEEGQVL